MLIKDTVEVLFFLLQFQFLPLCHFLFLLHLHFLCHPFLLMGIASLLSLLLLLLFLRLSLLLIYHPLGNITMATLMKVDFHAPQSLLLPPLSLPLLFAHFLLFLFPHLVSHTMYIVIINNKGAFPDYEYCY